MSKVGNEYIYSDASVDAVGNIISLVENGALKDKMIGILAQKSAIKNGATNINTTDVLSKAEIPLMHSTIDTNFIGVQLDANHISDQSVINETSQVVSALAQNQATPELYSELYSAIGEIINKEVSNFNKIYKTTTGEFDVNKISEDFVKVLKGGQQLGNANSIVDLLTKIGQKNIPISNANFFQGFAINVISKLSSDFIKRKYPGLGAVLNPSYGMLQLYETPDGKTYFHEDFLKFAEDGDFVTDINLTPTELHKQTINNVINRLLPNIDITPEEIKPLDRIIFNGITYNLDNINEYYVVKNLALTTPNSTIQRIHNVPRDLKPVEISFNQEGKLLNIFDNDPIRLT